MSKSNQTNEIDYVIYLLANLMTLSICQYISYVNQFLCMVNIIRNIL